MKTVCLLGSTGSIGTSTEIVLRHHADRFRLVGAAAGGNAEKLAAQVVEFDIPRVCLANEDKLPELRERLTAAGKSPEIFAGAAGLVELVDAARADIVLGAITGAAGLAANLEACRQGARIALANKESMVMAGDLFTRVAAEHGAEILPVDSEHNALFQALHAGRRDEVVKLILTASGGPFRTRARETFATITVEEALKHPTWDMGRKISIDSATMMNKTLEVLEARWLFDIDPEKIEVIVHPQSLVHSMVEFADGSIVAQMSVPDMKLPIQYALTYPDRVPGPIAPFRVEDFSSLTFEPADSERFPALELGFAAARAGGSLGAVLNGANEIAVQRFLDREIGFEDIARCVATLMERHTLIDHPTLDDVMSCDSWAREGARQWTSC